MLVGDYEFDVRRSADVKLLQGLSGVAAAAHAPFVSAASPKLFNMDRFTELSNPRDLAKIFTGVEYASWKSFRESEDSRYVALTCPRVLARELYGEKFSKVAEFNFEENVDGTDHDKYLWMNAAWAYAARITDAFAKYGWMARTRGVEGGGKVEGLPVHTFPTDDGDVAMKCPTEIAITDRREFELSNLGFLPLIHCKGRDFAVFMRPQSCQKPEKYDRARRNRQRGAVGQVQPAPVRVAIRPLPEGDGPRQDRLVHGTRRHGEVAEPVDQQLHAGQPGVGLGRDEGPEAAGVGRDQGAGRAGAAGLVPGGRPPAAALPAGIARHLLAARGQATRPGVSITEPTASGGRFSICMEREKLIPRDLPPPDEAFLSTAASGHTSGHQKCRFVLEPPVS